MHFQARHDKAGNAPALTDPTNSVVFPNLNKSPFGAPRRAAPAQANTGGRLRPALQTRLRPVRLAS